MSNLKSLPSVHVYTCILNHKLSALLPWPRKTYLGTLERF